MKWLARVAVRYPKTASPYTANSHPSSRPSAEWGAAGGRVVIALAVQDLSVLPRLMDAKVKGEQGSTFLRGPKLVAEMLARKLATGGPWRLKQRTVAGDAVTDELMTATEALTVSYRITAGRIVQLKIAP